MQIKKKLPVFSSIGVLVSIRFFNLPPDGTLSGTMVGTAIEPAVILVLFLLCFSLIVYC